jgi:cbb3-type cytochrome oxidase subunit 3
MWYGLTFLVFNQSIINFIRQIKFENLFGIGQNLTGIIYIFFTLILCTWALYKRYGKQKNDNRNS